MENMHLNGQNNKKYKKTKLKKNMRLCHITCNKSCKAEEPKIQIRLLK